MGLEDIRRRLMADPNLYNSSYVEIDPRFGKPKDPVLTTFANRQDCFVAGVHHKTFAGISGSKLLGAFSICLSGGYEDDKDEGDFLIYTGTGGQPDSFGSAEGQVADQTFDHKDNAALKVSAQTKRPVRVVRGPNRKSRYSPEKGYRYDGLYTVERAYMDKGKRGYAICKYELRLQRLPGQFL